MQKQTVCMPSSDQLIYGRYADGRGVPISAAARVAERRVAGNYAEYPSDPEADKQILSARAIAWREKETAWRDVPGSRGRTDVESPHGQWTRVECLCVGHRTTVLLNGEFATRRGAVSGKSG